MKRLGQYFLKNTQALHAIINALHITAEDTIIEIGPGHGELTRHLLASPAQKIIAIEKDSELAAYMRTQFSIINSQFSIIEGDALKILPALCDLRFALCPWKLVGNIPYYITGFLFRIIGELEHKPSRAVFMIQKEVAERVCEAPPRMNKLAASVQIWAEPTIIMTLPPSDFDPPPKVDSAIITLGARLQALGARKLLLYYRMVNILFRQPRKTIINNLIFGLPKTSKEKILAALAETRIAPTARPQNLSVQHIRQISLIL